MLLLLLLLMLLVLLLCVVLIAAAVTTAVAITVADASVAVFVCVVAVVAVAICCCCCCCCCSWWCSSWRGCSYCYRCCSHQGFDMILCDLLASVTIPTSLSRSSGSRPAHRGPSEMCFLLRLVPKSNSTFVTTTPLSAPLVKTYPAWHPIAGGTHVFAVNRGGVKTKQIKYQGEWGRKRKRYPAEWEKTGD